MDEMERAYFQGLNTGHKYGVRTGFLFGAAVVLAWGLWKKSRETNQPNFEMK